MSKHKEKYLMLGLNIAFYRKKNGLTQENLADILGISRNHISKVEAPNVDTSISLDKIYDIADALNVPVSKLFEIRD